MLHHCIHLTYPWVWYWHHIISFLHVAVFSKALCWYQLQYALFRTFEHFGISTYIWVAVESDLDFYADVHLGKSCTLLLMMIFLLHLLVPALVKAFCVIAPKKSRKVEALEWTIFIIFILLYRRKRHCLSRISLPNTGRMIVVFIEEFLWIFSNWWKVCNGYGCHLNFMSSLVHVQK